MSKCRDVCECKIVDCTPPDAFRPRRVLNCLHLIISLSWSEYDNGDGDHGGGDTGGDHWYMGKTKSAFRANVAYSLYGVLKESHNSGTSSLRHNLQSKCNKDTYINSFFTTSGAATLSSVLNIRTNDISYATSDCTYAQNSDGSYTSMTMGCDAKGGFTYASFTGKNCDGFNFIENLYELNNYTNVMMKDFECLQIWDYDTYVANNKNNNNRRHLKDGDHDEDDGYGSIAESLLENSEICNLNLYPHDCPDPYGIKNMYDMNSLRAQAGLGPETIINREKLYASATIVLLILSAGMALLAYRIAPVSRRKKILKPVISWPRWFESDKEITNEEYDETYDAPNSSVILLEMRRPKQSRTKKEVAEQSSQRESEAPKPSSKEVETSTPVLVEHEATVPQERHTQAASPMNMVSVIKPSTSSVCSQVIDWKGQNQSSTGESFTATEESFTATEESFTATEESFLSEQTDLSHDTSDTNHFPRGSEKDMDDEVAMQGNAEIIMYAPPEEDGASAWSLD